MGWAAAAQWGQQAVTNFLAAGQARNAAKATKDATMKSLELQFGALGRQQAETNEDAEQAKSDRARVADREIAALRVLNGERGASANTSSRMAAQAGYFEGMDLGRIETNRKRQVQALQDAKQGEANNAAFAIQRAEMYARNAMQNAIFGSAGAAVQIGAEDYRIQRYEHIKAGHPSETFSWDPFGLRGGGNSIRPVGYGTSNVGADNVNWWN